MLTPKLLPQSVRGFLSHFTGIIKPVLKGHAWRLVMILAADMLGVLSKASVVGLMAFFINSLQSRNNIIIPYVNITLEADMDAVYILSGGVFVLLLMGSMAVFFSSVWTRSLGRSVHVFFANQMLERLITHRCQYSDSLLISRGDAIKQIMRNAVHMGLAAENIIRAARPVLYFIFGISAAIYLDLHLSLLISPLALLMLPMLKKISSGIHHTAKNFYQKDVQKFGQKVAQVIRVTDSSSNSVKHLYMSQIEGMDAYLDGLDRNRLANDRMLIFTSSFQSLFIALAILVVGYSVLDGSRSWGEMLAYIMALYYVFNSFHEISAYIANLSRFFPQVLDYKNFESGYASPSQSGGINSPSSDQFKIRIGATNKFKGSKDQLKIEQKNCLHYIVDQQLGRLNYGKFIMPLLSDSSIPKAWLESADFVIGFSPPLPNALSENLLSQDRDGSSELVDILNEMLINEEISSLGGLDAVLQPEGWELASKSLKSILRLLPILSSEQRVAFVDIELINILSDQQRRECLNLFSDRLLFCVNNGKAFPAQEISNQVVVASEGKVAGIGDTAWYKIMCDTINIRAAGGNSAVADDESLYDL